jgi:hypothetical protein
MRTDRFWGRVVAAVSRNTPAFAPPATRRTGVLAALARQTPAFGRQTIDQVYRPDAALDQPNPRLSIDALLSGAKQGDRNSMDGLVRELTPLIWHVVRSRGLDKVQSEHVVQLVWLALLNDLLRSGSVKPHLRSGTSLQAWLITESRRASARYQEAKRPAGLADVLLGWRTSPSRTKGPKGAVREEALPRGLIDRLLLTFDA